MKKLLTRLMLIAFAFSFSSCTDYYGDYAEPRQETPNMPSTYKGRPVVDQGDIHVASKDVTFYVWDDEEVDGDIVTIVVNGQEVLSNYTLTGTKKSIAVTLDNKGYNYVLLYAHNEGTLATNTCALTIEDSNGEEKVALSANLYENAAMDIIVD